MGIGDCIDKIFNSFSTFIFMLSQSHAGNLSTVLNINSGGGSSSQPKVWLFQTSTGHNGNMGGRSGADLKCSGDKPAALTDCSTVRAFVSVNGTDEIRDMTGNYGVDPSAQVIMYDRSTGNFTLIVPHFSYIHNLPSSASTIGPRATEGWPDQTWTGSNYYGANGSNCSGWTTSSSGSTAYYGGSGRNLHSTFISASTGQCNFTYKLACICY